jgi:hypothetical protein
MPFQFRRFTDSRSDCPASVLAVRPEATTLVHCDLVASLALAGRNACVKWLVASLRLLAVACATSEIKSSAVRWTCVADLRLRAFGLISAKAVMVVANLLVLKLNTVRTCCHSCCRCSRCLVVLQATSPAHSSAYAVLFEGRRQLCQRSRMHGRNFLDRLLPGECVRAD